MPIPKQLPERAAAPPGPVPMPQPRPTFSGGPSNAGSGVMSQPVLQKTPGYTMEGDGDRVLSKKKLDELVRQVTGGGEGLGGGENLTPEVEEVSICLLCSDNDDAYFARHKSPHCANTCVVHPDGCGSICRPSSAGGMQEREGARL